MYLYVHILHITYNHYYKQLQFSSLAPFSLGSKNSAFKEHLNYSETKELILILV